MFSRKQILDLTRDAEKVFVRTEIGGGFFTRIQVTAAAVREMFDSYDGKIGDRFFAAIDTQPEPSGKTSSYEITIGRP